MAQSTISTVARALVALEDEEQKLQQRQLELAREQYQIWQSLEALKEYKARLRSPLVYEQHTQKT